MHPGGAAFVKTATGWAPSGATLEVVQFITSFVGSAIKVKAAGSIRNLDTLVKMYRMGVARFGINLNSSMEIVRVGRGAARRSGRGMSAQRSASTIIAYDLGTGGAKASLYDADGACLASTFVPYETLYPDYRLARAAARGLVERHRGEHARPAGAASWSPRRRSSALPSRARASP